MLRQRAWIVRSNSCYRRTSRTRRGVCIHQACRNSTSKSMPSPYWTSKLSSRIEHLQKKSRLVSGTSMLLDSLAAFADAQVQKVLVAIQSKAAGLSTPKKQTTLSITRKRTAPSGVRQMASDQESFDKDEAIRLPPKDGDLTLQDFVHAEESQVTQILSEMEMAQGRLPGEEGSKESAAADVMTKAPVLSQAEMDQRTRRLLRAVVAASTPASQLDRLNELNNHMLSCPRSQCILIKERALAHILRLREYCGNSAVVATARETLALLGYVDPPGGRGLRILSIDGGGTRGMLAIEMLRQLELSTGRRVHEMFDYVVGVSTGAILAYLLGGLHTSLDRCESLYRKMSLQVFNQNAWWGTGRLVWSHAYYDTSYWVDALRAVFDDKMVLETTRHSCSPKVAAVSIAVNQPTLRPFVFRNYNLPHHVVSHYYGSSKYKIWQAIRASGAAPGYFEEYELDGIVHQDGGLMTNNPTAVAIHEAKLLWPNEPIQCVVSLGGGRFIPEPEVPQSSTSLKMKILKVIDSATDTEAVHTTVQDLLPSGAYFRFNPYLSERITLDENRAEKLDQLKQDAQMYLRRNSEKFSSAVESLSRRRGRIQRFQDWLRLQVSIKW